MGGQQSTCFGQRAHGRRPGETFAYVSLSQVSATRWEIKNSIRLPVRIKGLECSIQSEGGEARGFIQLQDSKPGDVDNELPPINGPKGVAEHTYIGPHLNIWWEIAESPSDPTEGTVSLSRSLIHDQHLVKPNDGRDESQGERTCNPNVASDSKATSTTGEALQCVTPGGHATAPANAFCDHTDDYCDVASEISIHRGAVVHTTGSHASLAGRLTNLGNSLRSRFEHPEDLQDTASAMSAQKGSVQIASWGRSGPSPTHRFGPIPDHVGSRFVLPLSHTSPLPDHIGGPSTSSPYSGQTYGDLHDIDGAISAHRQAVNLTPVGSAAAPVMLVNLGSSLVCRFHVTGDLRDIAEAEEVQRKAVSLIPQDDPRLPVALASLGNMCRLRYKRTGDPYEVIEAISTHSRAAELTGDAELPSLLETLGDSFQLLYLHTGDLENIYEAISVKRRAVRVTSQDNRAVPSLLNSLATSLHLRFHYKDDLEDLEEALSVQRRAVLLVPDGDPELPTLLDGLAESLYRRSEYTGDLQDCVEGIYSQQRAVSLTLEGDPRLPSRLRILRTMFEARFDITGDIENISDAISAQQKATQLTPDGSQDLLAYLTDSGNSRYTSALLSKRTNDLDASISYFRFAATHSAGAPRVRLAAAVRWARVLDEHRPDSYGDLLTAFDNAIHMVSLVAGLEETVQRRYRLLKQHSGLPLLAANVAFRIQRPDKALEWLEQGRCLVWSQQSQLRVPLDELHQQDPMLAQRVRDVSQRLEQAGSTSRSARRGDGPSPKAESEARDHLRLAREWDDLLTRVRAIPSFQDFLLPPPYHVLGRDLPTTGPVVVINVHQNGCDAVGLVHGLDKPLHIPLLDFSSSKAADYLRVFDMQLKEIGFRMRGLKAETQEGTTRGLRNAGAYRRRREGSCIERVLEALWHEVVKPILNALGFQKQGPDVGAEALPRIWWCATGPLAFLPLHAAGVYRGMSAQCTMDYAVSSYTPSVTAISQRVKNDGPIDEEVSGILLTCQPSVSGAPRISGVTKEAMSVFSQADVRGVRAMMLEGDDVSTNKFLELMEKFSCVHLAAHASQNLSEPLQSRFLFHSGNLTLRDIMQRNLKNADFAFLSACETGAGDTALADEAVHLAAGMLAAGYRRVVATMWSINDSVAPKVADDLYKYLWDHRKEDAQWPQSRFDGAMSAHALHHAINQLRSGLDNGLSDRSLLSWIPYVHFGY